MKTRAGLLPALLIGAALMTPAYAAVRNTPAYPTNTSASSIEGMRSGMLEGREVIGMGGHRLGYVLAVNQHARMIDLQTPGGIAVAVPESRLHLYGGDLVAINMSHKDVLAMERHQTGRTVAINIDLTHGHRAG